MAVILSESYDPLNLSFMSMKKTHSVLILISIFIILTPCLGYSQTEYDYNLSDYFLNMLIPGYIQIQNNNPDGWFTLSGTGLAVSGAVLMLTSQEEQTELSTQVGVPNSIQGWLGLSMSQIGFTQICYNLYDIYNHDFSQKHSVSFHRILTSPLDPQILFDYRILPILLSHAILHIGDRAIHETSEFYRSGYVPQPSGTAPVSYIFAALGGFTAGYIEELSFRGILQPALSSILPNYAAIGITSLCFSSIHLGSILLSPPSTPTEWMNKWFQVGFSFVTGLYLGYLADENDEGIRYSIAYHSWHNFFMILTEMGFDYWYSANPNNSIQDTTPAAISLSPSENTFLSVTPFFVGFTIRI